MTSRPSKYLIVGQKVLDEVRDRAPDHVKRSLADLARGLETGPYPGESLLKIIEPRGLPYRNAYIVEHDGVFVLYQVMIDQPVIYLIGVDWRDGSAAP